MNQSISTNTEIPVMIRPDTARNSLNCDSTIEIRFVGHDATRTGAPLILLEFVKWLQLNTNANLSIYLKKGGDLLPEYQKTLKTTSNEEIRGSLFDKLKRALRYRPNQVKKFILPSTSLVYLNTVDTCDVIDQLPDRKHAVILHVHELEYVAKCCESTDLMRRTIPMIDLYIAASDSVKQFLMNVIGVPEKKIHIIHEFAINTKRLQSTTTQTIAFRQSLGIPTGAIVVGMCGTPEWRKGEDIFIKVAKTVLKRDTNLQFYFIWLGGNGSSQAKLSHDAERLKIDDRCRFLISKEDPSLFFESLDIFALTSREDPFPVVMLEAASYALPIICFEGGGGGPEFVENDAGVVVPYLDVEAMATSCMNLAEDTKLRLRYGQCGAAKIKKDYTLEIHARKILALIEQIRTDFESVGSGDNPRQFGVHIEGSIKLVTD